MSEERYMTRDLCEVLHTSNTKAITDLSAGVSREIASMRTAVEFKLDAVTDTVNALNNALYKDNGKLSFHTRLMKSEMVLRATGWVLAAMALPVLAILGVKIWALIATGVIEQ